jgi:hemerythrin superfamily protein
MDAVSLLKGDHQKVEGLFKRYEKTGPRALATRRKIADQIIAELSAHAAIEEQYLYPAVCEMVPSQDSSARESIEEHHIVKWVLSELDGRDPADERFDPKMTVVIELVRHHVAEEEHDLFPAVKKALSRQELQDLGDHLKRAKKLAPRHPHPRSSDTPPANLVMGAVAGAVDRARVATRDLLTR